MAVNTNNDRIYITLPKKQIEWLRKKAKEYNLPISRFVQWLLEKNSWKVAIQHNRKKTQPIVESLPDIINQEDNIIYRTDEDGCKYDKDGNLLIPGIDY